MPPSGRIAYNCKKIKQTKKKKEEACNPQQVLTLGGLSWLMMVVLPLLSSPKHKTLTSFFLRPSHLVSLSSSPIALDEDATRSQGQHSAPIGDPTRRDFGKIKILLDVQNSRGKNKKHRLEECECHRLRCRLGISACDR